MLYHREAVQREQEARADRIEAAAAGAHPNKKTLDYVRKLRSR